MTNIADIPPPVSQPPPNHADKVSTSSVTSDRDPSADSIPVRIT